MVDSNQAARPTTRQQNTPARDVDEPDSDAPIKTGPGARTDRHTARTGGVPVGHRRTQASAPVTGAGAQAGSAGGGTLVASTSAGAVGAVANVQQLAGLGESTQPPEPDPSVHSDETTAGELQATVLVDLWTAGWVGTTTIDRDAVIEDLDVDAPDWWVESVLDEMAADPDIPFEADPAGAAPSPDRSVAASSDPVAIAEYVAGLSGVAIDDLPGDLQRLA